jgi:ABC-type branched-subunit amino acid transport system substrate-binding protein
MYFVVFLLSVVLSCKTTTSAVQPEILTPVVEHPKDTDPKDDKTDIPVKVEEEATKPEKVDHEEEHNPNVTNKETEIAVGKKHYRMALILPFTLYSYDYDTSLDTFKFEFTRATEMAVEFYQGFKMAVDEQKKGPLMLDVHVYDDQNSVTRMQNILADSTLPQFDFMVGPVFNSNLRVAAEYCKNNKIPIISPLSSSSDITSENPYYYSANATETSHYEALINHIRKNYPDYTLRIIHNNTPHELKVIEALFAMNQNEFKKNPIDIDTIFVSTKSKSTELKPQLDSLKKNIVLIPSSQEIFSSFALNLLIEVHKKCPMVVYGMPAWRNFSKLNYDYLERLNVHLSSSYWVDETQFEASQFLEKFTTRYKMPPTEYAYQGYDLANYIISYLSSTIGDKKHVERLFSLNEASKGLQTSYDFIPRKINEKGDIQYWDNQFIQLLKFENYVFQKVK